MEIELNCGAITNDTSYDLTWIEQVRFLYILIILLDIVINYMGWKYEGDGAIGTFVFSRTF